MGAQSPAGYVAKGTITLSGPRGAESGTITVSTWGAGHCKVEIELGPAVFRRDYTAVVNGSRSAVTGPVGLFASAPLPVNPRLGCALLPEGLAGGAGALVSADAAGRPLALQWTSQGQSASLAYSSYQAGAPQPLPGTVVETVAGKTALTVQFTSIAPATFTDADFPLPPLPAKPAAKGGSL